MPFTIKTTGMFAGYEQGWSESYYYEQQNDDLSLAETLMTPIWQKRAKLLAKGYQLTVFRQQVVRNNAGQQVLRVADAAEPRIDGDPTWPAAAPNYALMCNWSTADNRKRKKQYLRGIPSAIGDLGKKPDLSFSTFYSKFNAWRSAVQNLNMGWPTSTAAQTAIITNYVVDPVSGVVTFTLEAPGFTWPVAIGKRFTVHVSLPGVNNLDGNVLVVIKNATTCWTAKPLWTVPFPTGQVGIMTINTLSIAKLQDGGGPQNQGFIDPQRIVTHKTGRPTTASRGRSSGRNV